MSRGVGCRWGSDLALLWLWCRLVATAPIRPLAWETPYAAGVALKKKKKKKRNSKELVLFALLFKMGISSAFEITNNKTPTSPKLQRLSAKIMFFHGRHRISTCFIFTHCQNRWFKRPKRSTFTWDEKSEEIRQEQSFCYRPMGVTWLHCVTQRQATPLHLAESAPASTDS